MKSNYNEFSNHNSLQCDQQKFEMSFMCFRNNNFNNSLRQFQMFFACFRNITVRICFTNIKAAPSTHSRKNRLLLAIDC